MLAMQREFYLDAFGAPNDPYAAYGVHNHAIMISGITLLAGETTTPRAFVETGKGEVVNQLNQFLTQSLLPDHPWLDPSTFTGFVILDIEHPVNPRRFWEWFVDPENPGANYPAGHIGDPAYEDSHGNPILFDHIIDGFSRRIAAARDVFPLAKLSVFPMFTPSSDGTCTGQLPNNIAALEYASTVVPDVPVYDVQPPLIALYSRRSWLDDLDYICVQLYPRYGPNDGLYSEATARALVEQGLEVGKRLADMETGVGVLPLLGFGIHNPPKFNPCPIPVNPGEGPTSCDDSQVATLASVQWMLDEVRRYAFVASPGMAGEQMADVPICFWSGDGTLGFTPRPIPEPQDIYEFMAALGFGCGDLNGDGVSDAADDGFWVQAQHDPNAPPTNPFHMVFDVDGDRSVTTIGVSDQSLYSSGCAN